MAMIRFIQWPLALLYLLVLSIIATTSSHPPPCSSLPTVALLFTGSLRTFPNPYLHNSIKTNLLLDGLLREYPLHCIKSNVYLLFHPNALGEGRADGQGTADGPMGYVPKVSSESARTSPHSSSATDISALLAAVFGDFNYGYVPFTPPTPTPTNNCVSFPKNSTVHQLLSLQSAHANLPANLPANYSFYVRCRMDVAYLSPLPPLSTLSQTHVTFPSNHIPLADQFFIVPKRHATLFEQLPESAGTCFDPESAGTSLDPITASSLSPLFDPEFGPNESLLLAHLLLHSIPFLKHSPLDVWVIVRDTGAECGRLTNATVTGICVNLPKVVHRGVDASGGLGDNDDSVMVLKYIHNDPVFGRTETTIVALPLRDYVKPLLAFCEDTVTDKGYKTPCRYIMQEAFEAILKYVEVKEQALFVDDGFLEMEEQVRYMEGKLRSLLERVVGGEVYSYTTDKGVVDESATIDGALDLDGDVILTKEQYVGGSGEAAVSDEARAAIERVRWGGVDPANAYLRSLLETAQSDYLECLNRLPKHTKLVHVGLDAAADELVFAKEYEWEVSTDLSAPCKVLALNTAGVLGIVSELAMNSAPELVKYEHVHEMQYKSILTTLADKYVCRLSSDTSTFCYTSVTSDKHLLDEGSPLNIPELVEEFDWRSVVVIISEHIGTNVDAAIERLRGDVERAAVAVDIDGTTTSIHLPLHQLPFVNVVEFCQVHRLAVKSCDQVADAAALEWSRVFYSKIAPTNS